MDDLVKDLRPCKVPEDLLPGQGTVPIDERGRQPMSGLISIR